MNTILETRGTGLLKAIAMGAITLCTLSAGAQSAAGAGATAAQPGAATGSLPPAPRAGGSTPRMPRTAGAPAGASSATTPTLRPCTSVSVDPPTTLQLGKSQVMRLGTPAVRMIVGGSPASRAGSPVEAGNEAARGGAPGGNPAAANAAYDGVAQADITLLSPTELFVLGRKSGSMNIILQGNDGRCVVKDLFVTIDPGTLQAKLAELMPEEQNVKVRGADNAVVLTGNVADSVKLDQVLTLAGAYGDGKRVVNMLRVSSPQQVMLEVKIAEVSRSLLDRLGLDIARMRRAGDRFSVFSGIFGGAPGGLGTIRPRPNRVGEFDVPSSFPLAELINSANSASLLGLDAQAQDGVVRVLAEPNIMAISGQAASFLSGGKIFIPVAQDRGANGGVTITLEEKEFGVGLKFTPTVLDGRINLKVQSEVSELSQTGSPFTTVGGVTAVLPSMATRKIDTTVQLGDGQSFVVAGLIKNNVSGALEKFPGLGEAPVLGALFRSTEFQNDRTELMFVVTPRLVKPVTGAITLPTDNHIVPSRSDMFWNGRGEGQPEPQPQAPMPVAPPTATPAAPAVRPDTEPGAR